MAVDLHGQRAPPSHGGRRRGDDGGPAAGTGAQWSPAEVRVDGQPARALARIDDVLWVSLDAGRHQVVLEGTMPERASVQLSLPAQAASRGGVGRGVDGGRHPRGRPGGRRPPVHAHRERERPAGDGASAGRAAAVRRVERTLHVGLDWEMDTHVSSRDARRVGGRPGGSAPARRAGDDRRRARRWRARRRSSSAPTPRASRGTRCWRRSRRSRSLRRSRSPWTEVWRMDIGPIWHASYSGIPFVHSAAVGGDEDPRVAPVAGRGGGRQPDAARRRRRSNAHHRREHHCALAWTRAPPT